jgi:site-specific recombinase XerD
VYNFVRYRARKLGLGQEGKALEIVQRVIGHRDIRSTQGYVDLTEAQVRAALEG